MSNAVSTLPVARSPSPLAVDVFSDPAAFEHAQRVANVFAKSNLVPPHLRGNVADCLIAYQIARRLNEEPLTVFQNIYVVSGRPGWKTEYVIARANKAGVFKGRITWSTAGSGDTLAVTANATLADTGEAVAITADMRMAKAEGWTKNQKYTSMPEHMLRWRSAAMLIRLFCPEVMLGMPIVEELETLPSSGMRDVTPQKTVAQSLDDFAKEAEESNAQPSGRDGSADTQAAAGESSEETAAGDGTSAEDKPQGQPEAQAAAETETSPTAAKETASVSAADPVEAARERGAADFRKGVQRKACPPEYRDKPEGAAWVDGWAKARAEAGL